MYLPVNSKQDDQIQRHTVIIAKLFRRTSDSLNEGLLIKKAKENFQRNDNFYIEKIYKVQSSNYPQKGFSHLSSTA